MDTNLSAMFENGARSQTFRYQGLLFPRYYRRPNPTKSEIPKLLIVGAKDYLQESRINRTSILLGKGWKDQGTEEEKKETTLCAIP